MPGLSSDVRRVIVHPDDRVCATFFGVLHEEIERLFTGLLAHLGVCPDVAADDGLEAAEDTLRYGRRAHDDAAHDSLVFSNAVSLERERRSDIHGRLGEKGE